MGQTTFFNDSDYGGEPEDLEKLEPACDATAFLKALGATVTYDKSTGIMMVNLKNKTYVFSDFSKTVKTADEYYKMEHAMRRMAGDLPYLTIKDMQKIFGFRTRIVRNRKFYVSAEKWSTVRMISSVRVVFREK